LTWQLADLRRPLPTSATPLCRIRHLLCQNMRLNRQFSCIFRCLYDISGLQAPFLHGILERRIAWQPTQQKKKHSEMIVKSLSFNKTIGHKI
jgi:hypothetical protein